MECEKVFAQIDSLQSTYLQVWEDICNIESPSACKAGVDAVGSYVIALAEKMGWKTEICTQEVAGNAVCVTMNPDAPQKPVSLSAHMDTVHPVGSFGTPAVHKDSEKIYGPGIIDCKGGAVVALLAMDALARCGYSKRPVQLLLQADEEVSSSLSQKETIRWICQRSKDSVAFLNLENNSSDSNAVIGRKGIIRYRFTVQGKKCHSAGCHNGANAIAEAAHKILELEKFKDIDGITCNCGLISGGSAANTVPGECSFVADIRFWNDAQLEAVEDKVRQVCDTVYIPGCSCTLELMSSRLAMPVVERNTALLEKINEILSAEELGTLDAITSLGGSDAAYVTAAGIPCVDSLGIIGTGCHTENECAKISSLTKCAKRIAAIVYHI